MTTETIFALVDPETGKIDPGLIPAGATNGLPAGGSAGQVLTKRSVTDGDAIWAAPTGGSSGGSTGSGSGLQSTVWFFPGDVAIRTSGAALVMPPLGSFELVGASLLVQGTASSSMSGETTVRFTAEGTPIGTITLDRLGQQTRGWHKTSADPAKRIFASQPSLSPETVIRCEILNIPTGSAIQAKNLSAQLWWRWTE